LPKRAGFAYFGGIFKHLEFCLTTVGKAVPFSPDWLHETRYDGYRIRVERDDDRVRLITRGDYNWSKRLPWIEGRAEEPH
jgi:bifunctional non-homologous end joining protein LigD